MVLAGQHHPDGRPNPHCERPVIPPHTESLGRRPNVCAALTAATRADVVGTVEEIRQMAPSFCQVERPMVIMY
jgi:hypothetical protein